MISARAAASAPSPSRPSPCTAARSNTPSWAAPTPIGITADQLAPSAAAALLQRPSPVPAVPEDGPGISVLLHGFARPARAAAPVSDSRRGGRCPTPIPSSFSVLAASVPAPRRPRPAEAVGPVRRATSRRPASSSPAAVAAAQPAPITTSGPTGNPDPVPPSPPSPSPVQVDPAEGGDCRTGGPTPPDPTRYPTWSSPAHESCQWQVVATGPEPAAASKTAVAEAKRAGRGHHAHCRHPQHRRRQRGQGRRCGSPCRRCHRCHRDRRRPAYQPPWWEVAGTTWTAGTTLRRGSPPSRASGIETPAGERNQRRPPGVQSRGGDLWDDGRAGNGREELMQSGAQPGVDVRSSLQHRCHACA